jgi:LacI family transcriptional regulator
MVTIKEIANACGVSSATVSRVLNYDMTLSIAAKKRQTIIETAEALNYATPRNRNRGIPQNQVQGASGIKVALIHRMSTAEELADPYYIGVRLGIETRCQAHKIEVQKVYRTGAMHDPAMLSSASGVIVVGVHTKDEVAWIHKHCRNVVFTDFCPDPDQFDSVESDIARSMKKLLDQLFNCGYRRIGFVGWENNMNGVVSKYGEMRCRSYMEWMKDAGLYDPDLLIVDTRSIESGEALALRLMSIDNPPDILITGNDNMAIGAYRAMKTLNLSIPDDIAIASFNDIPAAQFLAPPLSTVKLPAELIGETAVDLLLEQFAGRDFSKRVVISTEMIWRESCRQPETLTTDAAIQL